MSFPGEDTGPPAVVSVPDVPPGTDVRTAALAYAAAGLYLVPVLDGTKNPGSILGPSWYEQSSKDPRTIRRWFSTAGRGVAVHVGRSGLLAFDIDHPNAIPEELRQALERYQPPHQASRLGDLRRGHHFFALPPGVILGNSTGRLGSGWGDVRGRNGVIMLAPSVHPDPEGEYRWVRTGAPPELPDHLVRALTGSVGITDQGSRPSSSTIDRERITTRQITTTRASRASCSVAALSRTADLPPVQMRMLISGRSPFDKHHRGGVLDRSAAGQSLATWYVRLGKSLDEFMRDLTNPRHGASKWYSQDPSGNEREPRRLIERDYRRAVLFLSTHPPIKDADDARRFLDRVREAVSRATWHGLTGRRDERVLLVCLDEAIRRGTFTIHMSARSAADLAGMSKDRAHRALKSLQAAGWLRLRRGGAMAGYAAEYEFVLPEHEHEQPQVTSAAASPVRVNDYWASLAPSAEHVYDALCRGAATATAVVDRTGLTRPTVRKHLRHLAEDGMVAVDDEGRWTAVQGAAADALMVELVQRYDFGGRLQRQQDRHDRQRLAHLNWTHPAIAQRLVDRLQTAEEEHPEGEGVADTRSLPRTGKKAPHSMGGPRIAVGPPS